MIDQIDPCDDVHDDTIVQDKGHLRPTKHGRQHSYRRIQVNSAVAVLCQVINAITGRTDNAAAAFLVAISHREPRNTPWQWHSPPDVAFHGCVGSSSFGIHIPWRLQWLGQNA